VAREVHLLFYFSEIFSRKEKGTLDIKTERKAMSSIEPGEGKETSGCPMEIDDTAFLYDEILEVSVEEFLLFLCASSSKNP
jgi:hypothetical protein